MSGGADEEKVAEKHHDGRAEDDTLPEMSEHTSSKFVVEEPDQPLTVQLVRKLCLTAEQAADPELAATALMELRILRLDFQRIAVIDNLDAFSHVHDLYLQHNRIKEIDGLDFFRDLTFLALGSNRIKRIANLSHLRKLQFLDLSNNQIDEIPAPGEIPQSLRILNLSGNPICELDDYRMRVLALVPKLAMLDKVEVTDDERRVVRWLAQMAGAELSSDEESEDDSSEDGESGDDDEGESEDDAFDAEAHDRRLAELRARMAAGEVGAVDSAGGAAGSVEAATRAAAARRAAAVDADESEASTLTAEQRMERLSLGYNRRVREMAAAHRAKMAEARDKMAEEVRERAMGSLKDLAEAKDNLLRKREALLQHARERTAETARMHEEVHKRIIAEIEAAEAAKAAETAASGKPAAETKEGE